jgi:hypothetical protein
MERPGKCADCPRERLAFFVGEKGIGEEEKEKRNLPAKGEDGEVIREMERLPFALHRPTEDQRDQRDPARARDNAQSQQQDRQEKCGDKKRRGIRDRQLGHGHEQEEEWQRRGERGDVALRVLGAGKEFAGGE